ncbi:hypothetical protein FS749_006330 [Ceratobasidium sp. UAMH 11750]|nr:hypothetical protein FS749_006330 [Ceratobasidium sp. UAMH 11750]
MAVPNRAASSSLETRSIAEDQSTRICTPLQSPESDYLTHQACVPLVSMSELWFVADDHQLSPLTSHRATNLESPHAARHLHFPRRISDPAHRLHLKPKYVIPDPGSSGAAQQNMLSVVFRFKKTVRDTPQSRARLIPRSQSTG